MLADSSVSSQLLASRPMECHDGSILYYYKEDSRRRTLCTRIKDTRVTEGPYSSLSVDYTVNAVKFGELILEHVYDKRLNSDYYSQDP